MTKRIIEVLILLISAFTLFSVTFVLMIEASKDFMRALKSGKVSIGKTLFDLLTLTSMMVGGLSCILYAVG